MKNSLSITLSALLLICPVGIVAHAQDSKPDTATEAEKLPTPQEVVDLMVEFSGGAEALKDVKPVKSTGTFSIPQMQMTGEKTTSCNDRTAMCVTSATVLSAITAKC